MKRIDLVKCAYTQFKLCKSNIYGTLGVIFRVYQPFLVFALRLHRVLGIAFRERSQNAGAQDRSRNSRRTVLGPFSERSRTWPLAPFSPLLSACRSLYGIPLCTSCRNVVGTHMPSVDPMRCALRMPGVENRAGVVLSRPPLAMANGNVPRTVAGNVLGTVAEGARTMAVYIRVHSCDMRDMRR
jgi:hypothetical protein